MKSTQVQTLIFNKIIKNSAYNKNLMAYKIYKLYKTVFLRDGA